MWWFPSRNSGLTCEAKLGRSTSHVSQRHERPVRIHSSVRSICSLRASTSLSVEFSVGDAARAGRRESKRPPWASPFRRQASRPRLALRPARPRPPPPRRRPARARSSRSERRLGLRRQGQRLRWRGGRGFLADASDSAMYAGSSNWRAKSSSALENALPSLHLHVRWPMRKGSRGGAMSLVREVLDLLNELVPRARLLAKLARELSFPEDDLLVFQLDAHLR